MNLYTTVNNETYSSKVNGEIVTKQGLVKKYLSKVDHRPIHSVLFKS